MLPSVPRPARVRQEGLGWPGGGLICLFLEVHLEHGLSKVYIFIFLYQGFIGVSGEGRGNTWQCIFCWNMSGKLLNYRENLNVRRGIMELSVFQA